MTEGCRLRSSIELLAALVAIGVLAALVISPDWIERTIGLAPDGGDFGFEWDLALGAIVMFVVASWLGRRALQASGRTWPKAASRQRQPRADWL
jgi:hypothetical protein